MSPTRLGAAGLALLCWSACAGSSFELAGEPMGGQGGSAFPPLAPTNDPDDQAGDELAAAANVGGGAGAGGAAGTAGSVGQAGSAGAEGTSPAPTPGVCGELRGGLDDAEICVPAGTFTMGSAAARVPQGYAAHGPEHQVSLAAYVLDTYEVTVSRYRACVAAGGCAEPSTASGQGCTYGAAASDSDRLPVTCVSWDDADAFCAWDGGRRLPTEAEWERAARGTTGTTYAWGNDVSCAKGVFSAGQCPQHEGTTPRTVGSAPRGASQEGAMDLTGNAWEWVADWFGAYSSSAVEDPLGPNNGSVRIQRGGNWLTPAPDAAAYMRRAESPQAIGPSSFRCARGAP